MRQVRSREDQTLCGRKVKQGEVVRTTFAHARALQARKLADPASAADIKAHEEAKAKAKSEAKAKKAAK